MLGDSTELAARAVEAGARDVRLRVYPKMWHVWPMYEEACGQGNLPAATAALDEAAAFVHGVLAES